MELIFIWIRFFFSSDPIWFLLIAEGRIRKEAIRIRILQKDPIIHSPHSTWKGIRIHNIVNSNKINESKFFWMFGMVEIGFACPAQGKVFILDGNSELDAHV